MDPRAVWLRSLGWRESAEGWWSGRVVSTEGGRYTPMPLEQAFDVTVRRFVIDKAFRVEIAAGGVRLALPWRELAEEDRERDLG